MASAFSTIRHHSQQEAPWTPRIWSHWSFFTFIDIPEDAAIEHSLTQQQYARIEELVVARLIALRSLENGKNE
jgi:hypothetical protein